MGRPIRHPVDSLRTKVWFEQTSQAFSDKTAYWFWVNIDNKSGSLSKWNKYRTGERIPQSGQNSVELVAQHIPGTDVIFKALFWSILKGNNHDTDEIIEELHSLGGNFSILPKVVLTGGILTEPANRNLSLLEMFAQLALFSRNDIYTLQAIVLLMAWADKLMNVEFWNSCCDLYRHLLPELIMDMDAPFKDEIFDRVDGYALKRNFPAVNRREDIFKSWTEELPRFQKLLSEYYLEQLKIQSRYAVIPRDFPFREVSQKLSANLTELICLNADLTMKGKALWEDICLQLAELTPADISSTDFQSMGAANFLIEKIKQNISNSA